MSILLHWILLGVVSPAVDLSTIERKIAKEPRYESAEQYFALLVLGTEADKRVWFVVDGPNLFVDANGDGDLTGAGEKFVATKSHGPESLTLHSREWKVPKLALSDRYTNVEVRFGSVNPSWRPDPGASNRIEMERFMEVVGRTPRANLSSIHVTIAGARNQFSNAMFTTTSAKAPIFHMDGPLTLGVLETIRAHELGRRKDLEEINIAVGTPGDGGDQPGCFSYVMYEEFPKDARPVLEIEFPIADGKRLPPKRYVLDGKC